MSHGTFALRGNITPAAQFSAVQGSADALASLRQRAPRMTSEDFAARKESWLSAPREHAARLFGKRA